MTYEMYFFYFVIAVAVVELALFSSSLSQASA
ncbi:MAG: hypothetical protein QOJ98_3399 [Acidobacteriota bacterium]|jgi:hypothetical protein|nr:hypothetical protein [Acidobacteriota bacterium]